jgi:hypothetical protein
MRPDESLYLGLGVLVVLFVILLLLRVSRVAEQLPSLTLREYRVSSTPQHGYFVVIAGRPEGLLDLVLSVIGLGVDIRFEVSKTAVQRQMERVNRHVIDSVPLQNVASTNFGFTKKLSYLVLAMLLQFAGLAGFFLTILSGIRPENAGGPIAASFGGIFVGVIFLVAYFLSKRLLIQVETSGVRFIGVRFKPSIVGHLTVDLAAASKAVHIIDSLIARESTVESSVARVESAPDSAYDL